MTGWFSLEKKGQQRVSKVRHLAPCEDVFPGVQLALSLFSFMPDRRVITVLGFFVIPVRKTLESACSTSVLIFLLGEMLVPYDTRGRI
mmetsp:Transcript_126086/g.218422  ORF Transcript_126086/g.218422 Transcript_126086/m.218422 type:complete len:88 (-) Transcript_126086:956-1219(-)